MKLCIDSADVTKIRELCNTYTIDGVSTNPSILGKSGQKPYEVLKEIRDIIGSEKELFVQVVSKDPLVMVQEGKRIVKELGSNTIVKVPCFLQGYEAMKTLVSEGIRVLGTAVYSPIAAFLSAKNGASYVAPYINRIDNLGYNGVKVVQDIQDIIDNNGFNCTILAASFKNTQQVLEVVKYGGGAVTLSPEVFENFVKNSSVDNAIDIFTKDFELLTGKGYNMATV